MSMFPQGPPGGSSTPLPIGGAPNFPQGVPLSEMTPEQQSMATAHYMMMVMQSCPAKAVMSGGAGFALGGLFGLFMSSMAYDVPVGFGATQRIPLSDLPWRQSLRLGLGDMAKQSYSSAKNFGFIGLVYSGTECCIESLRAKNDIYNAVSAGCITGGGLAVKSGPQAALFGCGAFAAFSAAIELYLGRDSAPPPPNDED